MALIIVLSLIALATVLLVAFMSSVLTSGVSEKAAASETTAAQLASSAVQLVEGTITSATEPTTDTTIAWACQPGMIRTYGAGGSASSDPLAYYKLYSSNNMVISGKTACNQATDSSQSTSLYKEIPQYWDMAPALYTDLNAPLIAPSTVAGGTSQPIFPIVDPRAQDLGVEGFSTSATASNLDGTVPVTGVPAAGAAPDPNKFKADSTARLPMPVRWMYVLRDGTMTAPDGPGTPTSTKSTTATWGATVPTSAVPTAANPIVGRVAFWTDDEDAKVNVNTASEGTYMDTPISNSGSSTTAFAYPLAPIGDAGLSTYQGAQHEYQRYPGHPATTCLSTVFGSFLGSLGGRDKIVQAITEAIPRIRDLQTASADSGASSMGGTQNVVPTSSASSSVVVPPLLVDQDRLYASLDEFEFNPTRGQQNVGTSSGSTAGNTEQNLVDTCRFFLTAHSKAPELNLFGLPRVAMWPLWDESNVLKRTAFDSEILRCATINKGTVAAPSTDPHQMVFFRKDPTSATVDFNLQQAAVPANPQPRNQQVYGYLQTLMTRAVPGFGGSFKDKYGATDRDQILTEIFDFVRCTNMADQSDGKNDNSYTKTPVPGSTGTAYSNNAVGQVVPTQVVVTSALPLQSGTTNGFGRIATIAELALVLVKVDDRISTSYAEDALLPTAEPDASSTQVPIFPPNTRNQVTSLSPKTGGVTFTTVNPADHTLLEWTLMPKFFCPMAGYTGLGNDVRFQWSINNLKIGDAPAINATAGTLADSFDIGRIPSGGRDAVIGGLMGCEFPIWNGSPAKSMLPTGLCVVSGTNAMSGSVGGGSITISGDIDVKVFSPNSVDTTKVAPTQIIHFEFPSTKVPIPKISYWRTPTNPAGNPTYDATLTYRNSSVTYPTLTTPPAGQTPPSVNKPPYNSMFNYSTDQTAHGGTRRFDGSLDHFLGDQNVDTVRSLVPTGTLTAAGPPLQGDMRLIAALAEVPKTAFKLAVNFDGSQPDPVKDYQVDSLRMSQYFALGGFKAGSLIPVSSPLGYAGGRQPEVPAGINSVQMTAPNAAVGGDWDNGPGLMVDGPFINKPDEGEGANGGLPYIGESSSTSTFYFASSSVFSPNRQVSSPVGFGSLSVGMDRPWQTLLFRPANLLSTSNLHPGAANYTAAPRIADHLLLDLFWMPVVEPYGISEPFATSGKINLNTQIMPFNYITRTTGLRAVLKPVMVTALNPSAKIGNSYFISQYKLSYGTGGGGQGQASNQSITTRLPLDLEQTIGQITSTSTVPSPPADTTNLYPEFARATHTASRPNFFVSASQICDLPLIPQGTNATGIQSFWATNNLTGDNSLERPYSMIYPRVTTQSNIFTVHVIAQSLKKITTDTNQNVWNEGKDLVTSEYHGAYTIEKYFDPNTDSITTDSTGTSKSPASQDGSISTSAAVRNTKWRLLSVKRFGQ